MRDSTSQTWKIPNEKKKKQSRRWSSDSLVIWVTLLFTHGTKEVKAERGQHGYQKATAAPPLARPPSLCMSHRATGWSRYWGTRKIAVDDALDKAVVSTVPQTDSVSVALVVACIYLYVLYTMYAGIMIVWIGGVTYCGRWTYCSCTLYYAEYIICVRLLFAQSNKCGIFSFFSFWFRQFETGSRCETNRVVMPLKAQTK